MNRVPLRRIRRTRWSEQGSTWRDARPALIAAALKRAEARPSGNWFVLAGSEEIGQDRPFGRTVAGQELVAWRAEGGGLHVGPGACPHLGAPLCDAAIHRGALVCRWHGLALGADGFPGWDPLPAYDDGVLAWVRLDRVGSEEPLAEPVLSARPPAAGSVAAVATTTGVCEPSDVVANRLDPWHGAWFHPYSFANLRVLSAPAESEPDEAADRFLVEVTFTVGRRVGVPVVAEFTCPGPRTVVMRICEGEGAGSVVETHATPRGPGTDGRPRTSVIEATIAYSPRRGFAAIRGLAPAVRPLMRRAALRLWKDDLAYAERRHALRAEGRWPG